MCAGAGTSLKPTLAQVAREQCSDQGGEDRLGLIRLLPWRSYAFLQWITSMCSAGAGTGTGPKCQGYTKHNHINSHSIKIKIP
jgi:hypothetical protein